MELLQLKYFCKVAKGGSISAVAKEFSVPASSVSQSIKRLEKELNVKLFNRKANAVSLSEKGAVFLEYAEKSLNSLANGIAAASDDINSGEISICINTNRRIVMETVEKFKKLFRFLIRCLSYMCELKQQLLKQEINKTQIDFKEETVYEVCM